jgi:hypothetical protein
LVLFLCLLILRRGVWSQRHLQRRCWPTRITCSVHFPLVIFKIRSCKLFPYAGLDCHTPDLSLPSTKDYKPESPVLGSSWSIVTLKCVCWLRLSKFTLKLFTNLFKIIFTDYSIWFWGQKFGIWKECAEMSEVMNGIMGSLVLGSFSSTEVRVNNSKLWELV